MNVTLDPAFRSEGVGIASDASSAAPAAAARPETLVGENVRLVDGSVRFAKVAAGGAVPELPATDAPQDAETLSTNLEALAGKLAAATQQPSENSVMFSIYAVLDLIQEASQKMRDALRELRQLQNESIQTAILAQAAIQKKAAITGLAIGLAASAVQVVLTVGMLKLQMRGVDQSMGKLNLAKNDPFGKSLAEFDVSKSLAKMNTMLGVVQSLGGALNQAGTGAKELISAEATLEQADQKIAEEQLDQIKDLFSNALAVVQKAISVFESVTQKESSVVERIFG